jgi:hypothetical protein
MPTRPHVQKIKEKQQQNVPAWCDDLLQFRAQTESSFGKMHMFME